MTKAFVDTNIILDWLLIRPPFSKDAIRLFEMAEAGQFTLGTSAVSVITTEYFLRKSLEREATRETVLGLTELCYTIAGGSREITAAARSGFADFEDAYQYYCAKSWSADVIVTRDKQGFKFSSLPIMDARAFLVSQIR